MTSAFLSMWLSNTATTAMMLPIANAILESLFGDLETLKEKCKSPSDPELDLINGTEQNQLSNPKCIFILFIRTKQLLSTDFSAVFVCFLPKCDPAQVYFNLVLVS